MHQTVTLCVCCHGFCLLDDAEDSDDGDEFDSGGSLHSERTDRDEEALNDGEGHTHEHTHWATLTTGVVISGDNHVLMLKMWNICLTWSAVPFFKSLLVWDWENLTVQSSWRFLSLPYVSDKNSSCLSFDSACLHTQKKETFLKVWFSLVLLKFPIDWCHIPGDKGLKRWKKKKEKKKIRSCLCGKERKCSHQCNPIESQGVLWFQWRVTNMTHLVCESFRLT